MTRLQALQGGMHWKTVAGKEYLFRSRDRRGYGKSLGPRTPATERILAQFKRDKTEAKERESGLRHRLEEQARYCKAARVARVPRLITAIARALWRAGLDEAALIVGTNALYTYEAASGIQILSGQNPAFPAESRRSLQLLVSDARREGLTGILRKVDRSFTIMKKRTFRAVNDRGFMVDLIKPMPKPPRADKSDLKAADTEHLDWYLSSPRFRQIVIGDDGFAAPFTVPDPRVFAIHKLWLSKQPGREALKKPKDREQAFLVAELVLRFMPHLPFSQPELKMLPRNVASLADELLEGVEVHPGGELPPGFEHPRG